MADCGVGQAALISQQLNQAAAAAMMHAQMSGGGAEEVAAMEAAATMEAAAAAQAFHQHQHHQPGHVCSDWCAQFNHQQEQMMHQQQHQHQLPWAMQMEQQHLQQQQHEAEVAAFLAENQHHAQQQAAAAQHDQWSAEFEQHQQFHGQAEQVFGIEGQGAPLTYDEKVALSDFTGLMQDLRTGKVEIVEDEYTTDDERQQHVHQPAQLVVAGAENDESAFAEMVASNAELRDNLEAQAFLRQQLQRQMMMSATATASVAAAAAASASAGAGVIDSMTAEFLRRQQQGPGHAGQSEDMDEEAEFTRQFREQQQRQQEAGGEQQDDVDDEYKHGGADDWLEEYQEATARANAARESSEYPFEQNNPYLFHESPFEEGINFLAAGVLSEAVLAFEAACQQGPERLEAWQYLGTTQAENEKDTHAIIALNKARQLCPTHPAVLLALSACYTNEMMTDHAMASLRNWLKCDPKFADLEEHLAAAGGTQTMEEQAAALAAADEGEFVKDYFFVDGNEHRKVCQLFEAASQIDPMNVDVHVALGTLRHLGHDYLKAAAHFEEAVKLQPENEKLWNKLGATWANGNQSEKAIGAYQRALDINPGFVRAQYNLGIANSNLGRHREAARHFVKSIMLQSGWTDASCDENDKAPTRTTRDIWDVLRMSLGCLERQDLVQMSWQHKLTPFVAEFGCAPGAVAAASNNVQLVQELA